MFGAQRTPCARNVCLSARSSCLPPRAVSEGLGAHVRTAVAIGSAGFAMSK